ncbi:hypothetical protein [Streptomyces sp. NPDC005970]|uniref:hypothetical protein n=1 Tax=Streptomyces sp. NPDC005970 TaxID=3156723 RepID=UPI0033DDF8A1
MRRTHTAVTTLVLLALAACGPTDDSADKGTRTGYTVRNKTERTRIGSADLILTGDTKTQTQARHAIKDYAHRIDGQDMYFLKAMTTEDAPRYICRARWYKDAKSYAAYSDHAEQPSTWPHLAMNCP